MTSLETRTPNLAVCTEKTSFGNSHFQFHNNPKLFTGPKMCKTDPEDSFKIPGMTTPASVVIHQSFEEHNRKVLFNKSHAKSVNLDLGKVILLEIQYNMDLFYNPKLDGNIFKANKNMHLQSYGGNMLITNKAQVAGYKPCVWFYQKAITNLIYLKNII